MQNLQAKVEAHYTPQELQVPIVYLGSNKLIFQAILQAKDSTLEISKIQIDQGTAKYASCLRLASIYLEQSRDEQAALSA